MATAPIDYATYTTIVDKADGLIRKTGKALSRRDALMALATAYPDNPAYADAARRYTGRQTTPARAAVAKVVPVRKAEAAKNIAYEEIRLQGEAAWRAGLAGSTWEGMGQYVSNHPEMFAAYVAELRGASPLAKAAAPELPRSATSRLHEAVTTRQTAEGLSFVAALDAVRKATPALYAEYERDARYPHLQGQPMPVAKAAAPTYEAIVALADARVAKTAGLSRRDALIALVQEHPGEQAYYEAYRKYHVTDGLAEHHAAVALAKSRAGTGA